MRTAVRDRWRARNDRVRGGHGELREPAPPDRPRPIGRLEGELTFERVHFAYGDRDGIDLRELDLHRYRQQLGVVLQDPFLFSGTIAENLRFAKPQASDDEVSRIAQMVGLDAVARRFPAGFEHPIREGGSGLSAGERQLISIGRALLADPRILIFDEATSNIDRPTELLIERALDRLLHGRTSIIIAHRLSTARRADRIVVIDRGDIVQQGTGVELLGVDGPFRRLADAHLLGAQ